MLLADDHPATRTGIRVALEQGGFEVCAEVGDAEEAVRAALQEKPDLCLLDVRMPHGGGIRAAVIKFPRPFHARKGRGGRRQGEHNRGDE